MPIENNRLYPPDPFVMNEDEVNMHVANYLKSKGFYDVKYLTGKSRGVDVHGKKDCIEVFVESKGSHANHHGKDIVLDNNHLWDHLCKQICKLIEYRDKYNDKKIILIAANPDIPRIRRNIGKIEKSIEDLNIVRMWIKENGDVILNIPQLLKKEVINIL